MSDIEPKSPSQPYSCPYTGASEFEQALKKAEQMLHASDLDSAQDLLIALEQRYVRAVKLFDLLGDVLLQKGNMEEGIRYKTLHEVLRGTFKIAVDEIYGLRTTTTKASDIEYQLRVAAQTGIGGKPREVVAEPAVQHPAPEAAETAQPEDFLPVTAAMGHELMKQGHYDRALAIFSRLVEGNPNDQSLREALEKARKRTSEKKVTGVLQRWLRNIDHIKTDRSTEA